MRGGYLPSLALVLVTGCSGQNATGPTSGPSGASQAPTVLASENGSPPSVAPLAVVAWTHAPSEAWAEVEKLEQEQKLAAAATLVLDILKQARQSTDSEQHTRALLRYLSLRISLHGYEAAVRFLKQEPWPTDLLGSSLVGLYYSRALVTYAAAYQWEIRQRQRGAGKGALDLKQWTHEEIYQAVHAAYAGVYRHRQQLGEHPVAAFGELINVNTYPRGIRGTLRDTVSYLWVELLADTGGWRAAESNEVHRLNLNDLLNGPVANAVQAAAHPLTRISSILTELELWHQDNARPEAALEARLTLLSLLHQNLSKSDDRALIRQDLRVHLDQNQNVPWWSRGMLTLAGFVASENTPDNLIRARAIAKQGQQAFPDSIGGGECRVFIAGLDRPSFSIQGMASDAAEKQSLAVSYKNLSRIFLRAYPVDIKKFIVKNTDYNLLPDYREVAKLLPLEPAKSWQVQLPLTPDLKNHRLFITPPRLSPGFYTIIASARPEFEADDNHLTASHLMVTDLVMLSQWQPQIVAAQVVSGKTGRPIEGASVSLYRFDYGRRHRVWRTLRTDATGRVRLRRGPGHRQYFLMAEHDGQIALDPRFHSLHPVAKERVDTQTLIYTDRRIYRPLQTVHFKGILFRGRQAQGDFKTVAQTKVSMRLRDANGEVVATKKLSTNSYGSVSGSFRIPAGRLLGRWSVESSRNGQSSIRVEEYKRPTFEAKIRDPDAPLRLNRPATLQGEARYYFGLPVAGGKVAWQVQRTPVYPWWWRHYHDGGPGGSAGQTIATGTGAIDEAGRFSLSFTPTADEKRAGTGTPHHSISYRYSVTVTATDEGGESRSVSRAFNIGFVAVAARVESDLNFMLAPGVADPGTPERKEVRLIRTDLSGIPRAGVGTYRLVQVKQPSRTALPVDLPRPHPAADNPYRTAADMARTRWDPGYDQRLQLRLWPDGDQVASGALTHDDKGLATVKLPTLPAGVYRLRYSTTDAFGAAFELQHEIVVAGRTQSINLPTLILSQRHSVPVGDVARFVVHSGLSAQQLRLDFYQGGLRFDSRLLEAGQGDTLIELPVTESLRGGFSINVNGVRDHQLLSDSMSVMVPWHDKQLSIEVATFRDKVRPGTREKWRFILKGPKGEKLAANTAEVLAYMYDRSLDAFAEHHPPSPLAAFPNRMAAAFAAASLGRAPHTYIESPGFRQPTASRSTRGDALAFLSGAMGGLGRRQYGRQARSLRRTRSGALNAFADHEDKNGARLETDAIKTESKRGRVDSSGVKAKLRASNQPAEKSSGPTAGSDMPLRQNFSETAFFQPHLLSGKDGSLSIEFSVPDSVTSWSLWLHAITRDLVSGSLRKESRSVKELLVRPYLPRFLREGDTAELKVVVNNASDKEMSGTLNFDILALETDRSLTQDFGLKPGDTTRPFTVAAGGGTTLSFPVTTPSTLTTVAFKVTATSAGFSDGELRSLPLLPGRMHLVQSRFAVLKDKTQKTLHFADLEKNDDPTLVNDQMVVTIDGQLFYSVLQALPYLADYPYNCTEQTLNKFVSTGILTGLYDQYPAVARMAQAMSKRDTPLEQWSAPDPNRKMALEESPWLQASRGQRQGAAGDLNVLNPKVAMTSRSKALTRLAKMQSSSGGFPWFAGGPPSPYMTLYLLYGLSKAAEFGVDSPLPLRAKAWRYMHAHYLDKMVRNMVKRDCCWQFVTFLGYTLANSGADAGARVFSVAERRRMLDFSFKHWREHSPYLKGLLALTLSRAKRPQEAAMVWESVMDSALTSEAEGTHWAAEDRSWLWYNDTIETHAFALRTTLELTPKSEKLDGLVLWLFLNKKLNHWKSTRATAEVIYSLAHYLKTTGQLGLPERIDVAAGPVRQTFELDPEVYSGRKNQVIIAGAALALDPKAHASILVSKDTRGYAFASATWHFSSERLPAEPRADRLGVTRSYFKRVRDADGMHLEALRDGAVLAVGDEVQVQLEVTSKHAMEYVHLRDPRPAGFEPLNATSRHQWNLGVYWYEEIRDSGTNFFFENLPPGSFPFKYRLRATTAGTFRAMPATLQPMYAPEFAAYSSGRVVEIAPAAL